MRAEQTVEHERRIRERARNGDWELMYEGSAALGGSKVDREYEAKLLAKMQGGMYLEAVCVRCLWCVWSADDCEQRDEDDECASDDESSSELGGSSVPKSMI